MILLLDTSSPEYAEPDTFLLFSSNSTNVLEVLSFLWQENIAFLPRPDLPAHAYRSSEVTNG